MFNEATFREILVRDVINSNVNQYKVDRLNAEIFRDNLAGLAIPPGPRSSPGSPSSPSSPSLPPSSPGSSSSSSLTNVTLLLPSGSPRKTRTVRPRPTMSKIAISKRYQ